MNFNKSNNFVELNSLDDLKKIINIMSKFDSVKNFNNFINIMSSIPTVENVEYLTKSNENLYFFEILQSNGYFKLLDPIQKYDLFVSACCNDSIDIAMLILKNEIDLEGLKEFMKNYLAIVGTSTEYIIFRKVWEKNIVCFNKFEIEELFFTILKTFNLEFIEWFFSLKLIDLHDEMIKQKIGCDVLNDIENKEDFIVAKFICLQYMTLNDNELSQDGFSYFTI